MGRASKEQAGRNRQAVVESASRLLRAKGVDGVGIRELMSAAGLTQGAFSRQFASKESLATEACSHAFEGAERAFAKTMQGEPPGRSKRLVEEYLRPKPTEHACPLVMLAIDAARAPAESALRASFVEGMERLAHVVAGNTPAPDRLVLLAAMVGASILGNAGGSTVLTDRIRAAVIAFGETLD